MDNGKSLYKQLSSDKLYTKSYEDFVKQYGNPEGQKKLFSQLSADNLYSKSEEDFVKQYWSTPVKKKDQPKVVAPTTSVSKSVSAPTKPSSVSPSKEAEKEVGVLDDLWNTFKGAGAKALASIAAVPQFAQNAAIDIVASATGPSSDFNKLPSAVKKQVRDAISGTLSQGATGVGQLAASSQQATDYLNKKSEDIYKKTRQEEVDVVDELVKFKNNPSAESIQKILYQGLKTTVQSIPYMAVGAVSLPALAATSAAAKREEDISKDGDVGIGNLLNAGIYGASEAVFEGVTQKILGKAAKAALGNPAAAKAVAEGFVTSVVKGFTQEGLSEGATTLIQEVSDKITKGEDINFYKLSKQVANSVILGGLSGSGISAAGSSVGASRKYVASKIMPKKQIEKIDNNIKTIQSLNLEQGDDVDPRVNAVVNKKIDELVAENEAIVAENEAIAANLSGDQIKQVFDIDDKLEDNFNSAKSIIDDASMDDSAKKLLLEDLLKQQNNLKQEKDAIQKQATSQIPVQPEAGVGGEVAQGITQAEPQGTAEEVKKQKIAEIEKRRTEAMMAITNEAESMTEEERNNTAKERLNRRVEINDKLDAELSALDQPTTQEVKAEEVKPEAGGMIQMAETQPTVEKVKSKEKIDEIENKRLNELVKLADERNLLSEEEQAKTASDFAKRRSEINSKYDSEIEELPTQVPTESEKLKMALDDLRKAKSVKYWMEPEFSSESNGQPKNDEPNGFTYDMVDTSEGKATIINTYDTDGKIAATMSILDIPSGDSPKGAFKISTREDVKKQGYASRLLDEATRMGYDIPSLIKNNSFSKSGRDLLTSWLNKKIEQPTQEVKVEEVVPVKTITPEQKTEQVNAVQKGIDAVNKAIERGRPRKEAVQGGIAFMQKTIAYEQADDVTREQMLRDINKEFGVKEKKAPSAKKIMGTPAPTKVTVNEATALKDQIKLEAKAAKGGADFVKKITKSVGETLQAMVKSGSITPAQQKTIARGLKTNLTNPTILDRFLKKVDRIMRVADYKEKVRQANALRTRLATASKRDKLKPELRDIATALSKVQPSMLNNLQDYIDRAKEALTAMSPSRLVGDEVKEATLIDFKDFTKYANKLLDEQNDALNQDKAQEYKDLKESGEVSGDMSLKEIEEYLKKSEEDAKFEENARKEKILAEYAKASFANSKETVEDMIDEGEVSEEDLPLIKGFININTDDMNPKMAVKAADELRNYIHNGSKTGMGKILSNYLGSVGSKAMAQKTTVNKILSVGGVKNLVLKGIDAVTGKAMGLVKLPGTNLSGWYSDTWLEYVSQIDNIGVTAMGEKNWLEFKKLSGFDDIVSGFVRNKKEIDSFTNEFVKKYKKKKVDGKSVFSNYNATQAGIIADLYREVGSTPEEVAENFEDRKELLSQTLDYMKSKVRYKFDYEIMKELYDKLGIEKATSGKEVFNSAPKLMQDVVNDMVNEWDKYYPSAKRVAEEQYGILLGQNKNYTPYRYKVVSNKISDSDPLYDKGGYVSDFDILDTEEVGTFKKVSKVKNLPTMNGEVVRIPSYNFFQNNIDALSQTGNNINTIAGVNQFSGFTKSPYYKDIIKDDDSRNLLTSRMIYNISKLTDRERISTDRTRRGLLKVINAFSGLGTRLGLGAFSAGGTQALPALTNTLVNLEMNPVQMLRATKMILTPSEREWLNNLDETISGRGAESTTSLDYAEKMFTNKMFDNKVVETTEDIVKGISNLAKIYVDYSLVKSDVFAAKISWLSYYLTELEKKGVNVSNIKLSDTKVDKEAAKIADRKVQKEQNVNISELSGKLFSSKSLGLKLLRSSLLAFQSYTISSRDKIKTNMSILFNPSSLSTAEEKIEAMNSIAATIAEQITFSKVKAGVRNIVIAGAFAAVGEEESEEERKLREKRNQENGELNIFQSLTGSFGLGDQEWDLDIINSVLDYFEGTIDEQEVERRLLEQEEKDMMDEERDSEYTVTLTPEEKKAERLQRSLERPFRFYVPGVSDDDKMAKYTRYLGSGKVLFDVIDKVVLETRDDLERGGYYDKRGNFVEYNEKQIEKLKMLKDVAPFQLYGLTPSEIKMMTNEMKKIMKDRAYLNKMITKDEERKAKLDQ